MSYGCQAGPLIQLFLNTGITYQIEIITHVAKDSVLNGKQYFFNRLKFYVPCHKHNIGQNCDYKQRSQVFRGQILCDVHHTTAPVKSEP